MTNLNLAFDIAEQHLDIPKMLDAEGKNPDSPCSLILRLFRVLITVSEIMVIFYQHP